MSMPSANAVVGIQLGAEDKDIILDYLTKDADIVISHQINNIKNSETGLRIVPYTILNPDIMNIISTGTLVDLDKLHEEINLLKEKSGDDIDNIFIDERAHLILPYHIDLDNQRGNGIEPCNQDKSIQLGVRAGDLMDDERLIKRLNAILPIKNKELRQKNIPIYEESTILAKCKEWKIWFGDYIIDTLPVIRDGIDNGTNIVIVNNSSTLLGNDWGSYPYTGDVSNAIGIPPRNIQKVYGVAKSYLTFPKEGPHITAIKAEQREIFQEEDKESYVGWFDAVAVDYACYIEGVTHLCITRLDALDSCQSIKVCIGYSIDGEYYPNFPETRLQERAKPIYADFEGWMEDISSVRSWEKLPEKCKSYIVELEKFLKIPISLITVGKEKEQLIVREVQ